MKIEKLVIRNFRGIEKFEMELNGHGASVYGTNASGKSTIMDAWFWLLTGKDAQDRADFEVLPLGADGQVRDHAVAAEVTATIEHSGRTIELARRYSETWERKRGDAEARMTGHVTDCLYNGLPVTVRDYAARIAAIVPEKMLKVLSNPMYFSTALKWDERRRILMEITGGISEQDVAGDDEIFARLLANKGEMTMDEYRKTLATQRTRLNKAISELPARIDEVQRTMPEETDTHGAQVELDALQERYDRIHEMIALSGSDAARDADHAHKSAQIALREAEFAVRSEVGKMDADARRAHEERVQAARDAYAAVDSTASEMVDTVARLCAEKDQYNTRLEELRKDFVDAQKRRFETDTVCPMCQQAIPQDRIDAAVEKWRAEKEARLQKINKEGRDISDRVRVLDGKIAEAKRAYQAAEEALTVASANLQRARAEELPECKASAETTARLEEARSACAEAEKAYLQASAGDAERMRELRAKETKITMHMQEVRARITSAQRREQALARVDELCAEQKKYGAELERVEADMIACEDFARAAAKTIEDKVSGSFEIVRFKLFADQVNGGLKDCCEATVDGVPFASLNHAMQINSGIDIIRTIADAFGTQLPVFVDNAESVVALEYLRGGQIIRLVVSAEDEDLRVETDARGKECVA